MPIRAMLQRAMGAMHVYWLNWLISSDNTKASTNKDMKGLTTFWRRISS